MKVTIGISNHHVHLTEEDFKILFGNNKELTKYKDLNQYGQFASNEKVDIETQNGSLKGLRILGPFRNYTQVELSLTDAKLLKINPPVRSSGDLDGASFVTIIGPLGKVVKPAAIIADRHIHITKEDREKFNLLGIDEVSLIIGGEKGGVLHHVHIKEAPNSYFEAHIDFDDANAFQIENGTVAEISIVL